MFHAPPPFQRNGTNGVASIKKSTTRAYTNAMSDALYDALERDPKTCVLTAAMCEGNKLSKLRADFPDRFFDTGICEAHTVAFAAGMAKAGLRPIVDIYSTFLQRAFDHIFQEVALQNLPVTFCLDRAGIAGADGPTHHGAFDNAYLRIFPNLVVTAPGDELDVAPLLDFALQHPGPVSIRYPKANTEAVVRPEQPVELGKAEVYRWGADGMFVAFGTLFTHCVQAAQQLKAEGLDVGVINARFAKPLDTETIFRALDECAFVVVVEEGTILGGFGAAVLEAANAAGLRTDHLRCLGIPDRFIEHGERDELLMDLGLDANGLTATARALAEQAGALHEPLGVPA
jgi:1-deoxy-D-xylulose-5-phosphate synthase